MDRPEPVRRDGKDPGAGSGFLQHSPAEEERVRELRNQVEEIWRELSPMFDDGEEEEGAEGEGAEEEGDGEKAEE